MGKELGRLGFDLLATRGTAQVLLAGGLKVEVVTKVAEPRPNILDLIHSGRIDLIFNTPAGKGPRSDDFEIRRAAVVHNIPCVTTMAGAMATVNGIASMKTRPFEVRPLQEYHKASLESRSSR